MKRHNNNKSVKIILIGSIALVIILLDIGLMKLQYDNYLDKIAIICKLLNNEDTIDKASEILKTGKVVDFNSGREELLQYGYNLNRDNALYRDFQIHSMLIIGTSFVVFIVSSATILFVNKWSKSRLQHEIKIIDKLIMDYKQGFVDRNDKIEIQFANDDLKNLYDEVISFGDTLILLNDRERNEKESTKSLVSDISHQLKTPVAALKTSFEILQQELSPEERAEFTERCNIQIMGIENLLGALINISRMEAGMIDIKLEPQCIFDTILASINRVYEKAAGNSIQLEFEAQEELKDLFIPQDKKWLCEAFINIFENAIKYSVAEKKITIHMLKMVTFLRIEINDEGIGIPKDEYNYIFQRFYRGKSSEVKKQPGSGIGLYLTREIIHRHHGTIRVEAGENRIGSKFIIQLPCQ